MMPPKSSPTCSPHCLGTEKKKAKGGLRCTVSVRTSCTDMGRVNTSLTFSFYVFSQGRHLFSAFSRSRQTMEDFHIGFLTLISLTIFGFHSPSFCKDFFPYSNALFLLPSPHPMSKIKLIFISLKSTFLSRFSILKISNVAVSILVKRTWRLHVLSSFS